MKHSFSFAVIAMLFIAACGSTTDTEHENKQNYNAADSAVGNSDAANKIYRDTTDINSATESGGGTANPYHSSESDSPAHQSLMDTVRK